MYLRNSSCTNMPKRSPMNRSPRTLRLRIKIFPMAFADEGKDAKWNLMPWLQQQVGAPNDDASA